MFRWRAACRVIAANVNESGTTNSVSSRQKVRIVQRGGKTEVYEHETEVDGDEPDEA